MYRGCACIAVMSGRLGSATPSSSSPSSLCPSPPSLTLSSLISSSPLPLRPLSPVPVANADALGAALAGFEAAIASVEEFIRASAFFQDSQEQVGGYRHMLRSLAKSRAVARVIREGREYPSRTRPQPLMIAWRTESWIHFLPLGLRPRRPRWPETRGEMGRRASYLPWPGDSGISELLCRHRAREFLGAF